MTTRGPRETLEINISQRGLTVKVAGRQLALSAIIALTLLGAFYLRAIL
jgi:hypothetical protein